MKLAAQETPVGNAGKTRGAGRSVILLEGDSLGSPQVLAQHSFVTRRAVCG